MYTLSKGRCKGNITFPDGTTYSGEFENGLFNGTGTLKYTNGEKYTGQFLNGKREGNGTLIFTSGQKYIGPFKDDELHGNGRYYEDGIEYTTEFYCGKQISVKKVTQDTYNFSSLFYSVSSSASSTSSSPKKHDYEWDDGSYYIGPTSGDGKPQGLGTRYYPDGRKVYGEWNRGFLVYSPPSPY